MPRSRCLTNRASAAAIAAAAGAAMLPSCGGREASPEARALLAAVETPPGFEEGKLSLSGRVSLRGRPVAADAAVDSAGDPFCRNHGPIVTENWKVDAEGGLADVVISVVDAPPTVPAAAPAVTQRGCRYIPHVVGLTRGQSLEISNGDRTFHNVRVVRHQKGTLLRGSNLANYSQAAEGDRSTHPFLESGLFRLECDVHRWMQCWVFVADNNHLAISTDGGRFQLNRGLHDGTYTVQAWHHHFSEPLTRPVTVVAGRAEVNFEFDASRALN